MPIVVTCPGCRTRFSVSDKFAGKTGPCPKCKGTIRVPTEQEEVKIAVPEQTVRAGRVEPAHVVVKPIERKEIKIQPAAAAIMVGSAVVVLIATWAARGVIREHLVVRGLGLLLISPPLVVAGYNILRDDELEPYRGLPLYLRAGACTLVYLGLWGLYAFLAGNVMTGELWNWLFVAPPLLVAGALIAMACFDLEFGAGCFHYCFYVLLTLVLRWVAGMSWL